VQGFAREDLSPKCPKFLKPPQGQGVIAVILQISEKKSSELIKQQLRNHLPENQWEVNYRKETCRESYS
jgi:hypothetical protein